MKPPESDRNEACGAEAGKRAEYAESRYREETRELQAFLNSMTIKSRFVGKRKTHEEFVSRSRRECFPKKAPETAS
jgi:hypothetical protein